MKVGIILFHNMRYSPFLKFYESMLQEIEGVEYDIIYYNRYQQLMEKADTHHIPVKWYGKGTNSASKFEKILNFSVYPFQVEAIVKKNKYDFLIVLMTMPGILLSNFLNKFYKNRYVIDIRDYTQEHNRFYFRIEKKLLKDAAARVISSPGFKNFLPEGDYLLCHNLDVNACKLWKQEEKFEKAKNRRIVISYIGSISYEEQCLKLIDLVLKDDRFLFYFYGNESTSHQISDRIKALECNRIKMQGPFTPDEKKNIYSRTDLVFNCYGNNGMLVKYAISNKHYDGALYHTPLLVSPNTTMSDLAGEFGYALDLEHIVDLNGLYDWYTALDEDKYTEFANCVVEQAMENNRKTGEKILKNIEAVV